jgi:NAD(P)H-hydrate epimerase
LGRDKWASDIFDFIIKYPQPKVIDADGLVFVKARNLKQDNWVLTPHPGEAGEMLNTSSKNIQENRQLSLRKISNKFGGVIILKGHNTMIGHDENPPNICLKGNPGMATAGSGDVLAGIVSAMIGQGLSLFEASSVAVEIHAKAGDLASKDGERGLLAGDIIDEIRGCVN